MKPERPEGLSSDLYLSIPCSSTHRNRLSAHSMRVLASPRFLFFFCEAPHCLGVRTRWDRGVRKFAGAALWSGT